MLAWVNSAIASAWLPESARAQLEEAALAAPAELFDDEERPLVVALFGGTGVGKSTLLNRIAGQDIARASAERPTSTQVTAYLHRSQSMDRLPVAFPLAKLNTSLHHEERWKNVLWLDMPDVDSVATEHRDLVMQWLPHVDVVVFVASPERYRDARAWTVLKQQAANHAWLFVFNQADRGDSTQREDWRRLLAEAGFDDPALFATRSAPGQEATKDDFPALVDTLAALSEQQWISELDRRGITARLTNLYTRVDEVAGPALLPTETARASLSEQWLAHWQTESSAMADALRARLPSVVSATSGNDINTTKLAERIFDEAAISRITVTVGQFLQQHSNSGELPRAAAERELGNWQQSVTETLVDSTAHAADAALANPGTPWQRRLNRSLTALSTLLPSLALVWVGLRVLTAFRSGAQDPTAYLGVNFVITALLLVAVAWALPWWLARRTQVKPQDSLRRGLADGIERGLDRVQTHFSTHLRHLDDSRDELITRLQESRRRLAVELLPGRQHDAQGDTLPTPLSRLLSQGPAATNDGRH